MNKRQFWSTKYAEIPYYGYLFFRLFFKGKKITHLCQANPDIKYGDVGVESKFEIQQLFNQKYFTETVLLKKNQPKNKEAIENLLKNINALFSNLILDAKEKAFLLYHKKMTLPKFYRY